MELSFGARLRLQRERQQVSLETIAADTKIAASLFERLERDDVSRWPQGIFRRAYVRAYAQAIGLQPDDVLREFLERYPDAVDVLPAGTVAWPDDRPDAPRQGWSRRLQQLFTSTPAAAPQRILPLPATDVVAFTTIDDEGPVLTPVAATAPLEAPARESLPASGSLDEAERLCARLGHAVERNDMKSVLAEAILRLDAVGMMVWSWDPHGAVLNPALAHGYSQAVVARAARLPVDAGNAVTTAFCTGEICVVEGSAGLTGALAVPLKGAGECAGVLAIELRNGGEQQEDTRAFAGLLATRFVAWLEAASPVEAAIA